ncbi:MAG: hypothetical protein ACOCXJ_02880 [Planctomycetota bacterium]
MFRPAPRLLAPSVLLTTGMLLSAAEQSAVALTDGRVLVGIYNSVTGELTTQTGGIKITSRLDPDEVVSVRPATEAETETVRSEPDTPEERAARERVREALRARRRKEAMADLQRLHEQLPEMQQAVTAQEAVLVELTDRQARAESALRSSTETRDYWRGRVRSAGTDASDYTKGRYATALEEYGEDLKTLNGIKRDITQAERAMNTLQRRLDIATRKQGALQEELGDLGGSVAVAAPAAAGFATGPVAAPPPAVVNAAASRGAGRTVSLPALVAQVDAAGIYSIPDQIFPAQNLHLSQIRGKWRAVGTDAGTPNVFMIMVQAHNQDAVPHSLELNVHFKDADGFPLHSDTVAVTLQPGERELVSEMIALSLNLVTQVERVAIQPSAR